MIDFAQLSSVFQEDPVICFLRRDNACFYADFLQTLADSQKNEWSENELFRLLDSLYYRSSGDAERRKGIPNLTGDPEITWKKTLKDLALSLFTCF